MSYAFREACATDSTVYQLHQSGVLNSDIVVELVKQKKQMAKRILELESYAPKKVRMPDGSFMIWQCPIDLIPETNPTNQ